VCLFDAEYVAALAAAGHPMVPGATGENFDLAGLPWRECARPGARIALGRDVLLEISEVTAPCATTKIGFLKGENSLMDERKYPGRSRWYARVLRDGWVWRGDEARLLRMPPKDA
jgi:MOSC domain-containing protein YiiM